MPGQILSASARRYAAAAFAVARETGDYDVWLSSLDDVARVLRMPSAHSVFVSPAVSAADKGRGLARLFPDQPPVVFNFLRILADRDRLDEVGQIAEAMRGLVNQEGGVLSAEITTAVPLDAELEQTVAERLGAFLGHDPRRLTIRSRVDPNIIGGVVARVGDTLIDDSVRGRIERLRHSLSGR